MHRELPQIVLASLTCGCMAPHGMAPLPLAMGREAAFGELSGGYGVTSDRSAVRTDLGVGAHFADWGALELRGQYLHLEESNGVDETGASASRSLDAFQPYFRPAFFAGPVTFAVPLSGFAMGAGGGGVMAGLIGASAGFGGRDWNVFSGVQWQGSELVSSNSWSSSARELCFGARYALVGDVWRISLDPQIVLSSHRFESHSDGDAPGATPSSFVADRRFVMGVMQLSVAFGDLRPRRAAGPGPSRPESRRPPRRTPPPSACSELCDAQARMACGIAAGACRRACDARRTPRACATTSDALLRCEAAGLRCDGTLLVFPPCARERDALAACAAASPEEPASPQNCSSSGDCDGSPEPRPAPRRLDQPKTLEEAPE
ncbi:MAG: hypothetical protein IT377_30330 [Polyangiaceae bacterium]|nr:hypothetical protein [Polyangiaceae bacterium]